MTYYLYLVEYLDILSKDRIERYHLSNDPHEVVRQTYSLEDCIPKKVMYIGEFNLPTLSSRRHAQLQKEINQTSCPEKMLENLNQVSYD